MQDNQKNNSDSGPTGPSRRGFLKLAGVGAAFAALGANGGKNAYAGEIPTPKADAKKMKGGKIGKGPVSSSGRVVGANDRINLGFVGVGGQGFGAHVRITTAKAKENNTLPIAVSDCYLPRIERAVAEMAKENTSKIQAEQDYRRLIENKDIDAIVIATPEHWHAQIAIHAMEAGKHVYIEKPMTRYLDEAFQVYDCAKKTGKVVQVGSQGSSDAKWHAIGEAVRAGKIGPLVSGQGSYTRNAGTKGEWNYGIEASAGPHNLDWEMWLGSAPKRVWDEDAKDRFFRYRKYWDYSGGILGDLMPHKLHPFLIASGNPEFPIRVASLGTRKISLDRDVMDNVTVMAEFPSGWTMIFLGSTVNEQGLPDLLRGHKATINFGAGVEAKPERPYSEEIEAFKIEAKGLSGSIEDHHKNWFEGIRTGKPTTCNIDLATKVQTIVSMAEMAQRLNKTLTFDEKSRSVKEE